jgi:hypothetical protein
VQRRVEALYQQITCHWFINFYLYLIASGKDRTDIDALVLVKKLGMKVIATVSMVTYDPVWKAEPFADLCA